MPPSLDKQKAIDDVYRSPSTDATVEVNGGYAAEENYTIIDWFKKCLRNYVNFSGRARRKEYWYFILVEMGISIIASIIDFIFFDDIGLFYSLAALVLFLPALAVTVRRLHDTSHSGWWIFISLIPLIGSIILIVFLATETKFERNQWGPPAK